jgi:hypothetical protein
LENIGKTGVGRGGDKIFIIFQESIKILDIYYCYFMPMVLKNHRYMLCFLNKNKNVKVVKSWENPVLEE